MSNYLRNSEGESLEVVRTQYDHPERRCGVHTNGPAKLFWRERSGSNWYIFDEKSLHVLRTEFLSMGLGWIKSRSKKLDEVTE